MPPGTGEGAAGGLGARLPLSLPLRPCLALSTSHTSPPLPQTDGAKPPPPPPLLLSGGSSSDRERTRAMQSSALAGALAGGLSRLLTAPFDLIKIRFQLQVGPIGTSLQRRQLVYPSMASAFRQVARDEGITGLWRGNLAATYLWIGYGAVQFPVYESVMRELQDTPLRPASSFIAGAGAGLLATVVTYPFDVIRSQFAAQGVPRAHDGMVSFVRFILSTQGVKGLFAGLAPTAVQIVPRMGLSFFVYEQLEAQRNLASSPPATSASVDDRAAAPHNMAPHPPSPSTFTSKDEAKAHVQLSSSATPRDGDGPLSISITGGGGGGQGVEFVPPRRRERTPGLSNGYRHTQAQAQGAQEEWQEVWKRWLVRGLNGAMAGGLARILVHPLDTIKRRMQAQVMVQKRADMYGYLPTFRSSFECLQHIIANEGVSALYKGLVPTLLKAAVATSTTFVLYDLLLTLPLPH